MDDLNKLIHLVSGVNRIFNEVAELAVLFEEPETAKAVKIKSLTDRDRYPLETDLLYDEAIPAFPSLECLRDLARPNPLAFVVHKVAGKTVAIIPEIKTLLN